MLEIGQDWVLGIGGVGKEGDVGRVAKWDGLHLAMRRDDYLSLCTHVVC